MIKNREALFNDDPLNRSLTEILLMYEYVYKEDRFLRDCIRNQLSCYLDNSSYENPVEISVELGQPSSIYQMDENYLPCIVKIWQENDGSGMIFTSEEYGEDIFDFDDYSTDIQLKVLREFMN